MNIHPNHSVTADAPETYKIAEIDKTRQFLCGRYLAFTFRGRPPKICLNCARCLINIDFPMLQGLYDKVNITKRTATCNGLWKPAVLKQVWVCLLAKEYACTPVCPSVSSIAAARNGPSEWQDKIDIRSRREQQMNKRHAELLNGFWFLVRMEPTRI